MTNEVDAERDAFVERLNASILGYFDILSIRLGDRLGLFRALSDAGEGGRTSTELAAEAGIAERYAREWLEQQTVSGIVRAGQTDDGFRFVLPEGHAEPLLDRDSLFYTTASIRNLAGLAPAMDALEEAYRTGGGVPWESYGPDGREGVGDANRPRYLTALPNAWLPAIPDVHTRLTSEPPARVADIGCGTGWSSIAVARAYPAVIVDGSDVDAESIAIARENAAAAGLDDRVRFEERDAAHAGVPGVRYDLITFFECLHDMPRPVEALAAALAMLGEDGSIVIADERTSDAFEGVTDAAERYMYGWSLFVCLPTSMTDPGSAGTGAVMRPSTLAGYAQAAGLSRFEILPIEDDAFRLYQLRP
jgi:hypothetical protein